MGTQAERQPLLRHPAVRDVTKRDSGLHCVHVQDDEGSWEKGRTNGALRDGPPPRLFARETLGLLVQFAGVGIVSGVLPGVIYPVLQGYLNAEGTTIASATMLVQLPLSYKVFFGVLSDCFPIAGYRRRPYMVLGWSFCCAMLLLMGQLPMVAPYYGDPSMRSTNPDNWTPDQLTSINTFAPDAAGQLVLPMMLAAFGCLAVEVAADAIVVEYAQREPLATRGTLQSTIHCMRMVFYALGALVVAFAFNGEDYGGSFDFSLSFPQFMTALGVLSLPLVPISLFLVHEEPVPPIPLKDYLARFWVVLQRRAVYQIAAFKFFSGYLNNFNTVVSSNIKEHWVHATPFNASAMGVVGNIVYAATLALTARVGLHWNWRVCIALTVIVGVVLDGIMSMLVTWDIVRDQWFWLGVPVVGHIPDGVRFIVSNFVVVELVESGSEGALYGLLTTTSNLAAPFGRTTAKLINSRFHVWEADILRDSFETRRDVMITIWICYILKILSLALLPLLPRQKQETQDLLRVGGTSRSMATLMLVLLAVALVLATVINLLSMNESTRCWAITGGCPPSS